VSRDFQMVAPPTMAEKMMVLPSDFLLPIQVEPVGRWFLSHYERMNCTRGTSIGNESNYSESESEESETEENFEDDIVYLRSLDPKECKDQDHYRVLGMTNLRFQATDDQIKRAYRQKVLKHHPDKRKGQGEEIREGDDYFTCITNAFENLGVSNKRRAYDSVDPLFEDETPDAFKEGNTKDFIATFAPVFERNARWSMKKSVPKFGTSESTRDEVDKFYRFWYDFESWREFSYLDEEDKEKGSDREERRWIEKNNRVQRVEKKKEEMKRIRKLVDNAYNSDTRIARFKEEDRQEKAAKKKAKADAIQQRKDAEEKVRREAEEKVRKEQELKEKEEKERKEKEKIEKDAFKKAMKNEKRTLKNACKGNDYFTTNEDEKVQNLTDLDRLCEILSLDELKVTNANMKDKSKVEAQKVFLKTVADLNEKLGIERLEVLEKATKGSSTAEKSGGSKLPWSSDDLAHIVKAVNLFPAGTIDRWEVVASFINQHSKTPEVVRTAKETLSKAKEMQQGDFHLSSLKDEVNKNAYENLEKQKKKEVTSKTDDAEGSKRFETAAEVQGLNVSPWSGEEQKLLEQALKTFPASVGAERWDKIAECLPDRSKKDCMKRYKELAELIRAKKAAQAAAKAK